MKSDDLAFLVFFGIPVGIITWTMTASLCVIIFRSAFK